MNLSEIINNCKVKCNELINTCIEVINEAIEDYKFKKDLNTPINIVINSSYNYKNKKLNILKECLNIWSEKKMNIYGTITFDWVYIDPDMKEKIYFISSNKGELKKFQLYDLIDEHILSTSYMDPYFDFMIFKPKRFRENYLKTKTYYGILG